MLESCSLSEKLLGIEKVAQYHKSCSNVAEGRVVRGQESEVIWPGSPALFLPAEATTLSFKYFSRYNGH